MVSKKSDVWNHFSELDAENRAKCLYCGQMVATSQNSTGNLLRHLKRKHLTISILTLPNSTPAAVSSHSYPTDLHSPKAETGSTRSIRSDVWNHFSDLNAENRAKCVYCGQLVAASRNSTGNLLRHLKRKHINTSTANSAVSTATHHAANTQDSVTSEFVAVTKSETCLDIKQPPVMHFMNKAVTLKKKRKFDTEAAQTTYLNKPFSGKKRKDIDKQLVAMITKEYHPFNIVEDPEFKKLVHILCPSYELPTRKALSSNLIPAEYSIARDTVRKRIDRAFAICLTIDDWINRNSDSFYAITAHYIVDSDMNIKLSSDMLGCISFTERQTNENICNKMKELLTDWEVLNKIAVVVSDNVSEMTPAAQLGGWPHWGCFARSLNFVAQAGIQEIANVVGKLNSVAKYFRENTHAEQLKDAEEQLNLPTLKLKTHVPTRWNSTYDMIQRILQVKNAVIGTLTVVNTSLLQEEVDALTQEEWLVVEQSLEVLEIFEIVTNVISSETKVLGSSIILYYKQISEHLHSCNKQTNLRPEVKNLIKRLKKELTQHFRAVEDNEIITQSTILDPRFKKYGFIQEQKYKEALELLYTEVYMIRTSTIKKEIQTSSVPSIPQNSANEELQRRESLLLKDFDETVKKIQCSDDPKASAIAEVDKYLEEPLLSRQKDPLQWWLQRKHVYPRLYELMKKRLCLVATSVPCDRIFSKSSHIMAEKRERLKAKEIAEVVFLSYNLGNDD